MLIFSRKLFLKKFRAYFHEAYDKSCPKINRNSEVPISFLARRDECPESYCRTPGVGVGVRVRVHKNFNLAYNSWTTIGRAFIFHMCIPCDKTFPWIPKFLT